MELEGKTVVVTGAARGIGRAMCQRFAGEGAKVACADLDMHGAQDVADQLGCVAHTLDVASEDQVMAMIDHVESQLGPIDLYCSNAGILTTGGLEVPNRDWQRIWNVNVMSHVIAARHIVPRMVSRGGGYLLNTASAAGLLNQVGAAPYAVSKHAAVGFAEWLALTYGDQGIKVSVLCPQAVDTDMIAAGPAVAGVDGVLSADAVADACVKGLRDESFLILPHPEVRGYMRKKAQDYDHWIAGMQRLNREFGES